jgi:hypothetical protein
VTVRRRALARTSKRVRIEPRLATVLRMVKAGARFQAYHFASSCAWKRACTCSAGVG